MKRLIIIGLLASAAWAADFSQMNTADMMNMRGSVPVDDRPDFHGCPISFRCERPFGTMEAMLVR